MGKRANMVLMRVGDENRVQTVGPIGQPRDIGENQIDPGGRVHIGKGDAKVDENIPLLLGGAISIDIGVHTNFPCPTEGQINQTVVTAHCERFSLL